MCAKTKHFLTESDPQVGESDMFGSSRCRRAFGTPSILNFYRVLWRLCGNDRSRSYGTKVFPTKYRWSSL